MGKEKYSLIGIDSNVFSILAYTTRAMRRENKTKEEIEKFSKDVTSSKGYELAVAKCSVMINKLNKGAK